MTIAEQQLVKIETDIAAAFNRRDLKGVLAFFEEETMGFSSTKHERLRGLEDMRKTFNYYLQQSEKVEFALDEIKVQHFGAAAVSTFYWSVTVGTSTGEHEIHGRGSHVFVEKNGTWKIVHEHFSRSHRRPELWDTSPG
ncbi:MAG: nuclear transport factor 2 family protein [candidate division KSB1 bacterium]